MPAPTHTFFSMTALAAAGTVSLVSIIGATVANHIDPEGCTISPDNAGCEMHRPFDQPTATTPESDETDATQATTADRDTATEPQELDELEVELPSQGALAKIFDPQR